MLLAIVTFRGRCRIPTISKTKILVTTVNGIAAGQKLHPRCTMDLRSAS